MVRDEITQTVWPYVEGKSAETGNGHQSIPLEEAAAAHARMEAGDHSARSSSASSELSLIAAL